MYDPCIFIVTLFVAISLCVETTSCKWPEASVKCYNSYCNYVSHYTDTETYEAIWSPEFYCSSLLPPNLVAKFLCHLAIIYIKLEHASNYV